MINEFNIGKEDLKELNVKYNFGFKRRVCLCLAQSRHNFFFTVTDLFGKYIKVFTCGLEDVSRTRGKKTPFIVDRLMIRICNFLNLLGIKSIVLIIKMPIFFFIRSMLRRIHNMGFKVYTIYNRFNLPHNGCRRKKPRYR